MKKYITFLSCVCRDADTGILNLTTDLTDYTDKDDTKVQIMNYLAATGLKLDFLVNFCVFPKAEIINTVC